MILNTGRGQGVLLLVVVILLTAITYRLGRRKSVSGKTPPIRKIAQAKGNPLLRRSPASQAAPRIRSPTPRATSGDLFLYLVTGKAVPGPLWTKLSQLDSVVVQFAAWKEDVRSLWALRKSSIGVYYFPQSTWTQSRNFLRAKVPEIEGRFGRKFSFILFADEDLALNSRQPSDPSHVITDSVTSVLALHQLLLRDRPARASVEFPAWGYPIEQFPAECVSSCAFDGALDIYHRSVIDYTLPYSCKFDAVNWQMSQLITNIYSHSVFGQRCNLYRQISIDVARNVHERHEAAPQSVLAVVAHNASDCLKKNGLPGFNLDPVGAASWSNLGYVRSTPFGGTMFRPLPTQNMSKCTSQTPDVDYGKLLADKLKHWPKNC